MLEAIDRHGSIIEASSELGISYRKIRGAIQDMEATMGCALVDTHRGGGKGGGARLTQTAHKLMEMYIQINNSLGAETQERLDSELENFLQSEWQNLPFEKNRSGN